MYFAYGRNARPGMRAKTTFDAVVLGERTGTTRFAVWPGFERYRRLQKGALIEFFENREMKGRSVIVAVDEVREIDIAALDDAGIAELSRAEGWSVDAMRGFGKKYGRGVQVLYHVAGPLPDVREAPPAREPTPAAQSAGSGAGGTAIMSENSPRCCAARRCAARNSASKRTERSCPSGVMAPSSSRCRE